MEDLTTSSGVGNDLFADTKSIERIICPSRNAFGRVDQIEEAIKEYGRNKLVLLMLGPTAKVIAYDLRSVKDMWVVDIGHTDSEYEWFQMGQQLKLS